VLVEARSMFDEAVNYGWIDRNPALQVKHLCAPVMRKRLSLDEWQATYEYAISQSPPWVSRLLLLALLTAQRRADLQKMSFDDVWDGHLHIEQQKTRTRIALPLALRLDVVGCTLGDAIELCRDYAAPGSTLLRKSTGASLARATLTARFEWARESACGATEVRRAAPGLHECRSLSERLYRDQGIDTRTLLGHKHQSMTDLYNDDRGLSRGGGEC
jgi:integrase